MLQVRGLAKHYHGRVVFESVCCEVETGRSLVVTGPNGSGKSTFLKVLCGLVNPSAGTVVWHMHGQRLVPKDMMRLVGYVSPEMGLYGRLTAAEHVSFFASLRGIRVDDCWVNKALSRVQLAEYEHYPVGEFSSGMKQRMKLACALVHEPQVLILDEPSSNLDSRGLGLVDELITTHPSSGLVIVATNEQREVTRYGKALLHLGGSNGHHQEGSN